jgi:hypothetical protein
VSEFQPSCSRPEPEDRAITTIGSVRRLLRSRWSVWPGPGYLVAGLLALAPVVRMTWVVLNGSHLQHNDYWFMFHRFTASDGGLRWSGLFEFQNHPVVVPQLVYWLNLRAFSGSNIALGIVVVALALAQLAVVGLLLWRSPFRPIERMVILVFASALLFNLVGTWNFTKAMSGTAWLGANLFALVAVYLRSRGLRWPALAVAVLAAASYGTGLAVWPALVVAGLILQPRQWWREWPFVAGFGANFVWYQQAVSPLSQASESFAGIPSPADILRSTARMLSLPLGFEGGLAGVIGGAALIALCAATVAVLFMRRAPDPDLGTLAAWAGVAAFGFFATLQASFGRHTILLLFGEQNRYNSLPSLVWLAIAAISVLAGRALVERRGDLGDAPQKGVRRLVGRAPHVVLVAPVLVLALTAGGDHMEKMLDQTSSQELAEVAFHLDLVDGTRYFQRHEETPAITERMMRTGHYPFVPTWDLDCGLLGRTLATPGHRPEQAATGELIWADPRFRGSVGFTGQVVTELPVRCIVIVGDGEVVGAATLESSGRTNPDPESITTTFEALARAGSDPYRGYVVLEDSTVLQFGDELSEAEQGQGQGQG